MTEMAAFELGPDEGVIEWRAHELTSVMREIGVEPLALEPVLLGPRAMPDRRLAVTSDGHGVSWGWGSWDRVVLYGCPRRPGGRALELARGGPSRVGWRRLAGSNALELTPYDGGGAGVTVRVERPAAVPLEEVVWASRGDGLLVLGLRGAERWPSAYAQAYELTGENTFRAAGRPVEFVRGEARLKLEPFRGVVVVAARFASGRALVDCMQYVGESLRGRPGEETWRRVRGAIERPASGDALGGPVADWVRLWPTATRGRLRAIFREATTGRLGLSPDLAATALRTQPTGLTRAVALGRGGLEFGADASAIVEALGGAALSQALAGRWPALPAALALARDAADVAWALRNASHPAVAEALEWASGRGPATLDRALALAGPRARAFALAARLRPDSKEGRAVSDLLAGLEAALSDVAPHRDFEAELAALERRASSDAARPVDATGEPPITHERFAGWADATERMRVWRARLGQALFYCEHGRWVDGRGGVPGPAELESRLGAISAPTVRPRAGEDPKRGEQLRRACVWLLEARDGEPNATLRTASVGTIERLILPHAHLWGPLHEQVARGERAASALPWLASETTIPPAAEGLDSRARAASTLLDVAEALEAEVVAWTGKTLVREVADLRRMLSTPKGPRVLEAYEECARLYEYLALPRFREGLEVPARCPDRPRSATVSDLRKWWSQLRHLDDLLRRLRRAVDQFRAEAVTMLEGTDGALALALAAARAAGEPSIPAARLDELAAAAADPTSVSPRDYADVLRLLRGREEL